MSRDVFKSLSGSVAALRRLDVVSNNIANMSTTGFQAGRISFEAVGEGEHLDDGFASTASIQPIRRAGPLQQTGIPTHVALQGPGYFGVQAGEEILLTRDGRFHISKEGQLVTRAGHPVLGEGGPIIVPPGEGIRVTQQGEIVGSESGVLDKLRVLDGPLEHAGGNFWRPNGNLTEVESQVASGALEGSNVDPTSSMVELIAASRTFEILQKAMQTSDEMDGRLNQVNGG